MESIMKNLKFTTFLLLLTFLFSFSVFAQKSDEAKSSVGKFDENLAKKLGADEYGMKQYVFVFLKTGKAKIEDAKKVHELQNGHLKNIGRLAEAGKLIVAGPFIEGGEMRGIYIFDVKTIEEAKELVKTDPAINAGIFDVEFIKWYGSAALMQVNETHVRIQKEKF